MKDVDKIDKVIEHIPILNFIELNDKLSMSAVLVT